MQVSLTSCEVKDTLLHMSKKSVQHQVPEEESLTVTLPRPFGLRPGVYLIFLYGLILLGLLFFILILPGITNPGEMVQIESIPSGAAVHVNGQYRGATPLTVHVPKGDALIELEKPAYLFEGVTIAAGNRLFASRFFPKRRDLSFQALEGDMERRYALLVDELTSYSLVDTYVENYQFPPLISRWVEEMGETGSMSRSEVSEKLFMLTPFLGSAALFADALDAYYFLRGDEMQESGPGEIQERFIAEAAAENGLSVEMLRLALAGSGEELQAQAEELPWESAPVPGVSSGLAVPEPGAITLQGIRFVPVPGGTIRIGEGGKTQRIDSFLMADREITRGIYEQFLLENPFWSRENLDELLDLGLADSEYLSDWASGGSSDPSLPASGVSFYAARAFCEWLGESLTEASVATADAPSSVTGGLDASWVVRLPGEAEWDLARLRNGESGAVFNETSDGPRAVRFDRGGGLGIYDLEGNLWEWTGDFWFPLSGLYRFEGARIRLSPGAGAGERIVKGGSWVNRRDLVSWWAPGKQPPSWASPFLGFRPVIAGSRVDG